MSVSIYARDRMDDYLNLANGNFCELMELLGVSRDEYYTDGGLAGEIPVERVAALRVRISDALRFIRAMPDMDAGTPDREISPNFIQCGHSPGYYQMRLSQLLLIVDDCISRKVPMIYG